MKNTTKHDHLEHTHYYIKVGKISQCDTSHDNESHVIVLHNQFNQHAIKFVACESGINQADPLRSSRVSIF